MGETRHSDIVSAGNIGQHIRRKRITLGWSQEHLAKMVGATTMSVSRWERNLVLPQIYYQHKICEVFSTDIEEFFGYNCLQEHLSTSQTVLWNVPYLRNPYFTGREAILQWLHSRFYEDGNIDSFHSQAICGLRGIGKTQIVVEYAHRFHNAYYAVFWIASETRESIIASFQSIAVLLGLAEQQKSECVIAGVQYWLSHHHRWLLIWDNVEQIDILSPFLPRSRHGCMLFTTSFPTLGTIASCIELASMTEDEGITFLTRRTRQTESIAEMPGMVSVLEGLPLALDQAGAYALETPCSLADYLMFFQTHPYELLARRGNADLTHPLSAAETWSSAFKQIEQTNKIAANLLRLCACMETDTTSEELFLSTKVDLGEQIEQAVSDPFRMNDVHRVISASSLLKRDIHAHTLMMHPLVKIVLKGMMDDVTLRLWTIRAMQINTR